jgi:hypothetical protein
MWAGITVLVASLLVLSSCMTHETAVRAPVAPLPGLAKGALAGTGTKTESWDLPEKPDPAVWAKATNLFETGKYDECIVFCRENATVETLFLIVDCYVKLRQMESAVQQLREVETFFPAHAIRGSLKIIEVYHVFGSRPLSIAEKRAFIKKYPGHPLARELLFGEYFDDIDNTRRLIREQNGASFSLPSW